MVGLGRGRWRAAADPLLRDRARLPGLRRHCRWRRPPSAVRIATWSSTSTTTTSWPGPGSPRSRPPSGPSTFGASRSCCRSSMPGATGRVGQFSGHTPLIPADRLGAELGPAQPLPQGRLDQPALALLQGPGGRDGRRPRARAGQGRDRLRLDRQRRHRHRLARREGGPQALCLLPRQPRARQGARLPRARRPGLPARWQLRRSQPRLPRACAGERHRVRQHHPAPVLRGGGEDARLRGRRAARVALARPHRHAGRRGDPLLPRPQGPERAGGRRAWRRPPRPSSTSASRSAAPRSRRRSSRAARRSCPRCRRRSAHSLAIGAPGDGPLVVDAVRSRGGSAAAAADGEIIDGDGAACRHRGSAHRARRRHHGGGDDEARPAGRPRSRRHSRRRDQRQRPQDAQRAAGQALAGDASRATPRRWRKS